MPTKITELTPEQKAMLPVWRDKWIKIGLSCEPANFPLAEDALKRCYKFANLAEPTQFVHCGSPYVATVGGALASWLLDNGRDFADDDLSHICRDYPDSVADIKRVIREIVAPGGEKSSQKELVEAVRNHWSHYLGGQFWARLPAFESFFREVCHLEMPGDLADRGRAAADLAMSCGRIWPHEKFAVISDRPLWLDLNPNNRLHSTVRAAAKWRDNWAIYRVDGIAIERNWIEDKDKLDPKRCLTETNAELRRALTMIVGWGRVLEYLDLKEIVRDDWGAILETKDLEDDSGLPGRFLEMVCPSSGRVYRERIPPQITTPRAAHVWRMHPARPEPNTVKAEWYAPVAET